jgi:hypothetical protein
LNFCTVCDIPFCYFKVFVQDFVLEQGGLVAGVYYLHITHHWMVRSLTMKNIAIPINHYLNLHPLSSPYQVSLAPNQARRHIDTCSITAKQPAAACACKFCEHPHSPTPLRNLITQQMQVNTPNAKRQPLHLLKPSPKDIAKALLRLHLFRMPPICKNLFSFLHKTCETSRCPEHFGQHGSDV